MFVRVCVYAKAAAKEQQTYMQKYEYVSMYVRIYRSACKSILK